MELKVDAAGGKCCVRLSVCWKNDERRHTMTTKKRFEGKINVDIIVVIMIYIHILYNII